MKSLIDAIKTSVNTPRNDGKLHFSGDLQNPRHSALAHKHGIPASDKPWMNTFPLLQGTAVHEEVHRIMDSTDGWVYYPEQYVEVSEEHGFKYEWCGTVDAYLEDPDGNSWLVDYKTTSGVGLSFMNDAKPEHLLQVSAYYHFGPKIPNMRVGILYLPTSPDYKRRWSEPVFYEVQPLTLDELSARMNSVESAITEYLINGILPDPILGETIWKHNKRAKQWELWYKPHYTSVYCPWKNEDKDVCGCSKQVFELVGISGTDPNESEENVDSEGTDTEVSA